MFGYVRPFKGEMLVKEYDAYKAFTVSFAGRSENITVFRCG